MGRKVRINDPYNTMRVLIDCSFEDGDQTLIADDATEGDFRALEAAAASGEGVVIVRAKVTENGPAARRLIRASRIRNVRRG